MLMSVVGKKLMVIGEPVVFQNSRTEYISATFDSYNNKVVISYRDYENSEYCTAIVGTVSGDSISFGTPVVFNSASTFVISTAFDTYNNRVVISYSDRGNSTYGTTIVGTVSGDSISFGTSVVFNSANTSFISSCFNSISNKVVISYSDGGAYGKTIIGTVSGNSISFGAPYVFSNSSTYDTSTIFDSNNNKMVITYRDVGNSNRGTAIVGTVSGTSISFGTPVVFETGSTVYLSSNFDIMNNKVIVVYQDASNSTRGTAIVGTVSGSSISFGAPKVFNTSATIYISSTFYTPNNKVIVVYRDRGNSEYGTLIVGTVSGTSISFGTPIVFSSTTTNYISTISDTTNNKLVISYIEYENNMRGTAVTIGL
jgi:hypothetical protein